MSSNSKANLFETLTREWDRVGKRRLAFVLGDRKGARFMTPIEDVARVFALIVKRFGGVEKFAAEVVRLMFAPEVSADVKAEGMRSLEHWRQFVQYEAERSARGRHDSLNLDDLREIVEGKVHERAMKLVRADKVLENRHSNHARKDPERLKQQKREASERWRKKKQAERRAAKAAGSPASTGGPASLKADDPTG